MAVIFSLILLPICTVIVFLYCFYKKKFQHWKNLGFAYAEPSFPFGNILGMGVTKGPSLKLNDIYRQFPDEKYVGIWKFYVPTLLIRDPDLIKTITVRDFSNFHDRGIHSNVKDDPLSGNLFFLKGEHWRFARAMMTQSLSSAKIKVMFPTIIHCVNQLVDVLDGPASKKEIIDIRKYAACFTIDVISYCVFGLETDCLHNPESDFRKYGQRALGPNFINIARGILSVFVPDLGRLFNVRLFDEETNNFFLELVRDTIEYRVKHNIQRNDFMDLLIQLKENGKLLEVDEESDNSRDTRKWTLEEVTAQAFLFFVGGFETSSTTMQFALYELAQNQIVQKRAREDIRQVLIKHNNVLNYESVQHMEYLGRVVSETLRKYPPVPTLQRQCNADYTIEGTKHIIPKGTQISVSIYALHHDPLYFPDPETFDPDRFLEVEKTKRHPYSYIPFSDGPRKCAGTRFGSLQTSVGLAALLSNFKFSPSPLTPKKVEFDPKMMILQMKGNTNLRIEKL